MTGDQASNWEFFKDSWNNYATATKLDQKDKKIVVATLLSIMGKEFLHVCRNLPMTVEERQDANVILTKLDEYFVPKRNTIYERYVFSCRSQKHGKSFDQFLTLRASSVHLKMKCFVTASSLVCGITDTANVSHGKLRLLFKKPSIFVVQMKWQQINDSK